LKTLLAVLQTDEWREFWESLNLATLSFADLGLPEDAADSLIWQTCQREQLVLVTGNRNSLGPDSLEVTIRALNTPESLPVITLATPPRVLHERSYAERTAICFLERLLDIDRYRGAGRLYVP
jgi:hypothetical protein